jgi:hypothetical protein
MTFPYFYYGYLIAAKELIWVTNYLMSGRNDRVPDVPIVVEAEVSTDYIQHLKRAAIALRHPDYPCW